MKIVVMGVSGSGKSTLGAALAKRLGVPFIEGDELHLETSVEKMSKGIALTDEDRWPWLRRIGEVLKKDGVTSCSSLKRAYRDLLREIVGPDLRFIYLHGEKDTIAARMGGREGHYMPTSLLQSQLDTLEDPRGEPGVITFEISEAPDVLVEKALLALKVSA